MLKRLLAMLLLSMAMFDANAAKNVAPTITMTATLTAGTAPGTIALSATASDSDGSIAKVEFFIGSVLLTTSTQAPYSYTWSNLTAGSYSFTARATDNKGATTTTQPTVVTIAVGPPQVYYVYADQVSNPREIANAAGVVVWRADATEPFGANMPNESPTNQGAFSYNLRFPGQYFDKETGLHYNYYRDYDPQTGRYIESDPIGLVGGVNTYAYVLNDPLLYSDPNGLNPGLGCLAGAWAGPFGCGVGAGIGTVIMGGAALMAIISTPGDTAKTDQCPPNQPCQPCKTVSGKVVPVGTIGYRPMDTPPPGKPQHGITGPHYNIYKANQNPNNCQCFWQSLGAVPPTALPAGAIPIEPFAN